MLRVHQVEPYHGLPPSYDRCVASPTVTGRQTSVHPDESPLPTMQPSRRSGARYWKHVSRDTNPSGAGLALSCRYSMVASSQRRPHPRRSSSGALSRCSRATGASTGQGARIVVPPHDRVAAGGHDEAVTELAVEVGDDVPLRSPGSSQRHCLQRRQRHLGHQCQCGICSRRRTMSGRSS